MNTSSRSALSWWAAGAALAVAWSFSARPAAAGGAAIGAEEAARHIGTTNTVCGRVVEARYLSESQRKLTFLNFEAPYPDQVFDAVIEEPDRPKFSEPPETAYKGKKICVEGVITEYNGRPQIKVTDPRQISEVPPS
jgi:hypothetical protein